MQKALNFEGDDVPHHLQRGYSSTSARRRNSWTSVSPALLAGGFHLDLRCAADVEPMGDDYVIGMCPPSNPTFDATATITRARCAPSTTPATGRPASALCVDRHHRRSIQAGIPALDAVP